MATFHFPQFEHELFGSYFKLIHTFFAQCSYGVGISKILDIVDEGVSSDM